MDLPKINVHLHLRDFVIKKRLNMDYQRQINSLEQQKQRENERHQRALSQLDKQKQAELDKHNRNINNIKRQIQNAKNAKLVRSHERFEHYSNLYSKLDKLLAD